MNYVPRALSLPREFLGQARAFRERLKADDVVGTVLVEDAVHSIRRRLKTHPVLRREHAIDLKRRWERDMPTYGRLAFECTISKKCEFELRELRLSAADFSYALWEGDGNEPGISIMGVTVIATLKRRELKLMNIAYLGLHALGRRYQRGFDNSDPALFDEFRLMAASADAALDSADGVGVPGSGGTWVGYSVPLAGEDLLAFRTYLHAE